MSRNCLREAGHTGGRQLRDATLVQPAGSSHPFAANSQANFRLVSCTSNKDLLVRLIRGKSWKREPQTGKDFPPGVLVNMKPILTQ